MGLMDRFADPELFESLGFGEKMMASTITMLMGLGVTFLVLILLYLFVKAMGGIMKKVDKGGKASASNAAANATPSAAAAPVAAAPAAESDDSLIAVIAAAIAAYEGTSPNGLVVRKISRISGEITPWSNAAREDCIDSRKF